ncbi:hypothetical protein L4D20_12110 [Vibrio kyushuensis]|uniref:hypothetical protein n=1 Tax=Vibrio kyushuensis TaxID=2910249 RepID=UPI003D10B3D9
MKKTLMVTIVSVALALTGCSSSSDSNGVTPQKPSIPDMDDSPQWGLDLGDTPDWGLADPDFGIPDVENTPDRLPPVWGGPEMPPIDNGPEASYTIDGNTITGADGKTYLISSVDWHGQGMTVLDKEGNEYNVSVVRQGDYEGDFGVVVDGESIIIGGDTVQGGLRPLMETSKPAINRDSIRDSIRSRLN